MLWRVSRLIGRSVAASDGDIGKISDVLFDERSSAVRYYVVDTGGWFTSHEVLLAPAAVGAIGAGHGAVTTALTRTQVKESPPIDRDRPVSRQQEERLHAHYGWSPYWYAQPPLIAAPWGVGMATPALAGEPPVQREAQRAVDQELEEQDPHLRSANEVMGYYVRARDGDIGHVEDMLLADDDQSIRYLVIDTRNWLPGRQVLVATHWFRDVSWSTKRITTDLSRDEIKNSPEWSGEPPDRAAEEELHRHYGRDPYWVASRGMGA